MSAPAPHEIHKRAFDDLRYIRSAVASASEFTAVSGLGGVAMGLVGAAAAMVASFAVETPQRWVAIWIGAAVVAAAIGVISMVRKARRAGPSLVSAPARRFGLAFTPGIVIGAALTITLITRGAYDLLPPLWLLAYGSAVTSGGALSVRIVPFMGMAMMAAGLVALFVPFAVANLLLGFGFGLMQIATGVVIIRRYGG